MNVHIIRLAGTHQFVVKEGNREYSFELTE
jgi:hypothetical protein